MLGEWHAHPEGKGGSQTGKGYLDAHGKGEFMTGEPLGHHLADGDSGNLAAHAEDGETKRCHQHLILDSVIKTGVFADKRNIDIGCTLRRHIGDGIVFYHSTHHNQDAAQISSETNAHLVEDDTSEEEHQQEYVDESIGTREHAIVAARPSQSAL